MFSFSSFWSVCDWSSYWCCLGNWWSRLSDWSSCYWHFNSFGLSLYKLALFLSQILGKLISFLLLIFNNLSIEGSLLFSLLLFLGFLSFLNKCIPLSFNLCNLISFIFISLLFYRLCSFLLT